MLEETDTKTAETFERPEGASGEVAVASEALTVAACEIDDVDVTVTLAPADRTVTATGLPCDTLPDVLEPCAGAVL